LFLVTKCEIKNCFSEDGVFSTLTKCGAALLICKSRCTLKIAHDEVPAYTIFGSQNCLKGLDGRDLRAHKMEGIEFAR
jgi:hypothetical protein